MMELKCKKRYAQQLIEFLLVAPFIIILLGIMTEYAYALYVRMVVNEGLKQVTTVIYKELDPTLTKDDIQAKALKDLNDYLASNNIATEYSGASTGSALSLEYITLADTTIFVATYKYIPAISFPKVYFHFLPDQLDFTLTSAVPTTFIKGNDAYKGGPSITDLDNVWGASGFSSLSNFDAAKKGVQKATDTGADKMVFLVPVTGIPALPGGNNYAIVKFSGSVAGSANTYQIAGLDDGNIYDCAYTAPNWVVSKSTDIKSYLSSYNYNNIIFVHDANLPSDVSNFLSGSAANWADVLPRTLALVDFSGKSVGNYDNLEISSYNPTVGTTRAYTVEVQNGRVFVSTAADNVNLVK